MSKKRLWLGCLWALTAGCQSAADPGRDDDAQNATTDAGADGAAVGDSGTKSAASPSWCDVVPITSKNCVPCHKPGGVGPMSLESYADFTKTSPAFPSSKLYERMGVRIHDAKSPMPSTGMLNSADLAVLDAWIAAGAPAAPAGGCDAVAVEPTNSPQWPKHCDAIHRITAHAASGASDPVSVPAGQEIHPKVDVDAPWGDEEVQAIAFRPVTDNEKVLHHWILYGSDRTFLTGWAPGSEGMMYLPSDVGMSMPHGAKSMYLDMHYFNLEGTVAETDQSGVEVCLLKKQHFRPKTAGVVRTFGSLGGSDFVLAPAGQLNHSESGSCPVTVTQPVHLISASPHAHTRAVHMKFTVKKADGREIVMHDEDFFFHAQKGYPLAQEVILETGDTVVTTCTYSNDTTQDIRFGESTTDEMCFNFAMYYPKDALKCGGQAALLGQF